MAQVGPGVGVLLVPVGGQPLVESQQHGQQMLGDGGAVGSGGAGEEYALRQYAGSQIGVYPGVPALNPFQPGEGFEVRRGDKAHEDGGPFPPLLGDIHCAAAVTGGEKEMLLMGSGGAEAILLGWGQGEQMENGFHSETAFP